MILLDLFCGRWGWSRAFAKRGWRCIGVDLIEPPEIPEGCEFSKGNVLDVTEIADYDAIVASPPCEQFSVHGMKHFHPNPPYPELGIKLFNHTREICERSGLPYVIENVRPAQQFVGNAVHHCGPFYLWGNAVPPILNQGIRKGLNLRNADGPYSSPFAKLVGGKHSNSANTSEIATIPMELANCVCDYFERILEQRKTACQGQESTLGGTQ